MFDFFTLQLWHYSSAAENWPWECCTEAYWIKCITHAVLWRKEQEVEALEISSVRGWNLGGCPYQWLACQPSLLTQESEQSPDGSVTDPRENAVGWNEIKCPWKERHGAIADVVWCKNDTCFCKWTAPERLSWAVYTLNMHKWWGKWPSVGRCGVASFFIHWATTCILLDAFILARQNHRTPWERKFYLNFMPLLIGMKNVIEYTCVLRLSKCADVQQPLTVSYPSRFLFSYLQVLKRMERKKRKREDFCIRATIIFCLFYTYLESTEKRKNGLEIKKGERMRTVNNKVQ